MLIFLINLCQIIVPHYQIDFVQRCVKSIWTIRKGKWVPYGQECIIMSLFIDCCAFYYWKCNILMAPSVCHFVCWLVGPLISPLSVCHNFRKGREVTLSSSYHSSYSYIIISYYSFIACRNFFRTTSRKFIYTWNCEMLRRSKRSAYA